MDQETRSPITNEFDIGYSNFLLPAHDGVGGEPYPTTMATNMRDDASGREDGPDADEKRRIRKQKRVFKGLDSDSLHLQIARVARRPLRVTGSDDDDQR